MVVMTSKDFRIGIKRGFTMEDFCKKYDLDETTLQKQLGKAFPHGGSDEIMKEMQKNKKHHLRQSSKPKLKQLRPDDRTNSKVDRLSQLKSTEAELSAKVICMENDWQKLAATHREYLGKMRDLQRRLDKLITEIDDIDIAYNEVVRKNNEVVRKMNTLSQSRSEKIDILDRIREEITALTAVVVAVYDDCNLEVIEGNISIDLADEEDRINILAHRMMDRNEYECFTLKQIRTLAKLVVLNEATDKRLEFLFDDGQLEKAFAIIAS